MDTGSRGELLAANLTVDEIRDYLDVDSLAYLQLDRLVEATGAVRAGFCDACLTGHYPVPVPVELTAPKPRVVTPGSQRSPLEIDGDALFPSEQVRPG
jgi:glutamine phosphoribosylpyrophosphate amidotransferase